MKTITEYQPLIFGRMRTRTEEREQRRGRVLRRVVQLLPFAYVLAGVALTADTGFTPWHWQFWLVFAPLFAASELAIRQYACRVNKAAPLCTPAALPAEPVRRPPSEPARAPRTARPIFRSTRSRSSRFAVNRPVLGLARLS